MAPNNPLKIMPHAARHPQPKTSVVMPKMMANMVNSRMEIGSDPESRERNVMDVDLATASFQEVT